MLNSLHPINHFEFSHNYKMKLTGYLAIAAAVAVAGSFAAPIADQASALESRAASSAVTEQTTDSVSFDKRFDSALGARTIDPAALSAEIEAILAKLGKDKQLVVKYLYWIRNVIGYKKKHLLEELESLLEKHGLSGLPDLGDGKLPDDIEAIFKEIGGAKKEIIKWLYWVRNVLGYKKKKLLHQLEDRLHSIGVLKRDLEPRQDIGAAVTGFLDSINHIGPATQGGKNPQWLWDIIPETVENILGPLDGII